MRSIRIAPLVTAFAIWCMGTAHAQQLVIPLYPGAAPGSGNATQQEASFIGPDSLLRVRNVTQPTLTAYLPAPGTANGTAIIVAPGGGFMHLAMETEGTDVAKWLQARRGGLCIEVPADRHRHGGSISQTGCCDEPPDGHR